MGNCRGAPTARSESERLAAASKKEQETKDAEVPAKQDHVPEQLTKQETATDVLKKVREAMHGSVGERYGPQGADVEWLNFAIKEIWPFVDKSVTNIIKESTEPAIREALPNALSSIHFSEFSLGTNPPVLGPVNVSKKVDMNHPGVELAIGVNWECNANITLACPPGISIGIRKLTLVGEVYIILRPLLDSVPIVGGIQITMVAPPDITWELTGLAQVVQFPTIASTLKGVIKNLLCESLVLPNRVFIHWVWGREKEIDITAMQYPMPEAMIRLGVVEARGIQGKDWNLFGKATSDPYARIQIGARSHDTPVQSKTLEPKWNDEGWFDFLMYTSKQLVNVELFDSDRWYEASDDTLGELVMGPPEQPGTKPKKVRLCDLLQRPDDWWKIYSKNGSTWEESGEVKIQVEAFALKCTPNLFTDAAVKTLKRGKANADGLLTVQLRGLRGLPKTFASAARMKATLVNTASSEVVHERISIPCSYHEPDEDPNATDVDPSLQRMVEYMFLDGKDMDTVIAISGLTASQVGRILDQRPSFHSKWNQSLHIPLGKPHEVELQLVLMVPKDSKHAAPIVLQEKFLLKDKLMSSPKLKFEELVKMVRQPGPAGLVDGPFDLDICVHIHGLVKSELGEL